MKVPGVQEGCRRRRAVMRRRHSYNKLTWQSEMTQVNKAGAARVWRHVAAGGGAKQATMGPRSPGRRGEAKQAIYDPDDHPQGTNFASCTPGSDAKTSLTQT
ncbi:hypothetical protein E2C01_072211 [Portunus trituberculatus]|uniref:Uncharacterized protein n=1 Tax=Portunus trituberculatus TaxID=210409 RepID=A0A5B7I751_PORTR|nr:hypothetical protein [Portunus trituberculatus]